MSSKQIFDCWKASVQLLKWENLKLILLAGINNFLRSTKLTLQFGWWLMPFYFLPGIHAPLANANFSTYLSEWLVHFLALKTITILYILTCRPSLERKDLIYLKKYAHAIPPLLVFIFTATIFFSLSFIFLISAFFFLDSEQKPINIFKSILNSFKFAIYFPAIIFPFIILNLFEYSLFLAGLNGNNTPFYLLPVDLMSIILLFFQLSILSILYTKIRHTFPDLFI